jgi:hypothetical protein
VSSAPVLSIELPLKEIARFCKAHEIRALSVFGSALRDDFTESSDIDVLVEFEPGATPGLAIFALSDELAAVIGRPVDLITRGGLRGPIGKRILASAVPIYERG